MAPPEKVCLPSASGLRIFTEVQGTNAAPSTLHWNVAPGSFELNAKLGVLSLIGPLGPDVMCVSGGVASTTKLRAAGVESGVWPLLRARTEKACVPLASVSAVNGEAHLATRSPSIRHEYSTTP